MPTFLIRDRERKTLVAQEAPTPFDAYNESIPDRRAKAIPAHVVVYRPPAEPSPEEALALAKLQEGS